VIRVSAPGSIGNFGPGLDIIGCAVTGLRDVVEARFIERRGLHILDTGHPDLPSDATQHACGIAARAVLSAVAARGMDGADTTCGVSLRVTKGLPLSGGQGGSAASAVAAAHAVNTLLGDPLGVGGVIGAALQAEAFVAGRHLDNIIPALLGGIVLVRGVDPPEFVQLAVPEGLRIALVLPEQRLRTVDARAVLPQEVSRATAVAQASNVASIVWALERGDLELLGRAIDDRIAEPARAVLIPGFSDAKRAAIGAGALGCSISGAGPTTFALAGDDATAERVVDAMCAAYADCGVAASGRVARVDERGAMLENS
jgi:homoserine kinase